MAIIYGRADSEIQLLRKYPKEVRKIEDIPRVYDEFREGLGRETGVFAFVRRWNKKRQIKKFEKNRTSHFHAGAKGENKVLARLSELSDDYHVLCGLRIGLPHTIRYRGQKNLRSAQMDFVVVSKKGVFVIEVKNWSDDYVENHSGFSPYEQTDRAGRVLWVAMRSILMDVRITSVLLSVRGNMQYDRNYRTVLVSSLERIKWFLEKEQDSLSEKEVERIVGSLKCYTSE